MLISLIHKSQRVLPFLRPKSQWQGANAGLFLKGIDMVMSNSSIVSRRYSTNHPLSWNGLMSSLSVESLSPILFSSLENLIWYDGYSVTFCFRRPQLSVHNE